MVAITSVHCLLDNVDDLIGCTNRTTQSAAVACFAVVAAVHAAFIAAVLESDDGPGGLP